MGYAKVVWFHGYVLVFIPAVGQCKDCEAVLGCCLFQDRFREHVELQRPREGEAGLIYPSLQVRHRPHAPLEHANPVQ